MGKTESARELVADQLLGVGVGEQIPTTAQLAEAAEVGYGTVVAALRSLTDDEIVAVSTHGHQGTRLVERDSVRLWKASGRGPLVGVLPLPQSLEFSGLATAVHAAAESRDLPVHLMYRQGAAERFGFLTSGRVDWIVASAGAGSIGGAEVERRVLDRFTYYGRDAVVVITASGRQPDGNGRVPIDRRSYDHTLLTETEFPDAEYIETPYLSIPELVVRGAVDAAVWHQTSSSPLLLATGLALHPLRHPSPPNQDGLSRAAIYWRKADRAVATLVDEVLSPDVLQVIQREVIAGARIPQY